ncbi:multidrug efflux SMR transporter (plasmid) [Hymenobacter aerilatus]|uniref:Multidrug efflux SMR transporter n=1 Tax=Hymenobacter aerilatus TaxID=2932251 RepID=A0A8T9T0F7_9BACT|nr:multidrug efflux SMR transporter [Hymenobacter aerilatus]UOR07828.1 multidrug efflux SMR transporter [Hymenobacter aerilatus]
MKYIFLFLAIVAEVIATSAMKASNQFTLLLPSLLTVAGYGVSFYLLSFALKSIPVGIAYATWSGVGIVLVSAIGVILYKQRLDGPAVAGIALIIAGVLIMNLFSKTSAH